MKRIAVLLLLATACGAKVPVGTTGHATPPPDSAAQCVAMCQHIGLELDSVVVMANNVGCVCTKAVLAPTARSGGAGGGMAAILLQQQAAQAAQSSRTSTSRR